MLGWGLHWKLFFPMRVDETIPLKRVVLFPLIIATRDRLWNLSFHKMCERQMQYKAF